MKKLLFSLSLIGALAAFADDSIDASAQTFGVLTIESTETNVIVSVPWVAATNTNASTIPVADIIKTANLTDGDWIRVWDQSLNNGDGAFRVWTLVSNATTSVKTWEPGSTVTAKGLVVGAGSGETALSRGQALILHRQNPDKFYIYGQYLSTSAGSITCAKATEACPKAYTLIAPPGTTATAINSINWGSNVGEDDYITISGGRLYYHYDTGVGSYTWGGWTLSSDKTGRKRTWTWTPSTYQIPAGQGLWFTSATTNATSEAVVVTW